MINSFRNLALTFILFFVPVQSFTQSPFSDRIDSLITTGIDQTLRCEFDSVMVTFNIFKQKKPEHFVGYFYLAATLQSEMMDYESDSRKDEFYSLIDKAVHVGELQVQIDENDSWTHFYLGTTYLYKGMFQAKSGSLISGFISAKNGIAHLKQALQIDSTLYDAYLGLGSYEYWSGRLYKYLKWLPWIKDNRKEGVKKLRLAVQKGTFSKWIGINSLAWIEYDRKNFFQSLMLFRRGLRKYPESRFFLWGYADCLFMLKDYKGAVFVYQKLLEDIKTTTPNYGYNEAEIRRKLMLSFFGLRLYDLCVEQANLILKLNPDKKIEKRIKKHKKEAKEYIKRCKGSG